MKQKFHAHIYFELSQRSDAEAFYFSVSLLFPAVQLGRIHLNLVGPHSLPMFTAMFGKSEKKEFTEFLLRNRNNLSVLIHEDTGDDVRDHTLGVEWIGNPLPIRFEHFERIKFEKSALVFPE